MRKALALFLLVLLSLGLLEAQDPVRIQLDSLMADSVNTPEEKTGFFTKDYPDPMKAGIMSLAIPGTGQMYNKSWWKVPFVYAALGGMVYFIKYNSEEYHRFEDAFIASVNGEEHEFSGTAIDNPTSLRNIRDGFDKNRQLSWVGLVFVYVLNGVEAFVDAHLQNFDIDDELSIRLKPQLDLVPVGNALQPIMGIGISIPLNRNPTRLPAPNSFSADTR